MNLSGINPEILRQSTLIVPALKVQQSKNRTLYQFTIDGKQIPRFASISRIRRDEDREIAGYQRPEALSHINSIRKYIDSDSPMIPNSIVIAFKREVHFEIVKGQNLDSFVVLGHLHIPVSDDLDDGSELIGWIVDGQQRSAAIRGAKRTSFPIPVTSFVAMTDEEQREQFILVNSVKPLSKSLIYELLPTTHAVLPGNLARRRLSATVLGALNSNPESPFFEKIQTPTNPNGSIKDNTVLRMLDNSILDGVLYNFRDPKTGDGDVDKMCQIVNNFFASVRSHFPIDWELKPRQSRLVHGVGIVSMGYLMDEIALRSKSREVMSQEEFFDEIDLIAKDLHWSSGKWRFPDVDRRRKVQPKRQQYKWVPWNDLQNTTRDVSLLTQYILDLYRSRSD